MQHLTSTASPAPPYRCEPWCTRHVDSSEPSAPGDPADQLCIAHITSPAFDRFALTHIAAEGTMIALYDTRKDLKPHEAKALAYSLLAALATVAGGRSREVAA